MTVDIIDFSEADRNYRDALVALHFSAWGGLDDLATLRRLRALGFPFAPYVGLYAREGDALLSAVIASHYPLTTPDGAETAVGIEMVMTRPDATRHGLAGALLREVHRRERSAGQRLSLLCTGRSNLAHELYLKLGYQDIFSPRASLRYIDRPRARPPPGIRVRRARGTDAPVLARVHRRANAGALGFTRRSPRSFRVRFLSGTSAIRHMIVAQRRGHVEGYATMEPHSTWIRAGEVIAPSLEIRAALMAAVERSSTGRWVAYGSDWFEEAAPAGSAGDSGPLPSYAVMMACPLVPGLRRRALYPWLRSEGRRFACQQLDMF